MQRSIAYGVCDGRSQVYKVVIGVYGVGFAENGVVESLVFVDFGRCGELREGDSVNRGFGWRRQEGFIGGHDGK